MNPMAPPINQNVRIKIAIDGKVLFDGNPGEWQDRPPDLFKDMIRPGVRPEPWMQAILVTMSSAVMGGQSCDIRCRTSTKRGNAPGWAMEVTYH